MGYIINNGIPYGGSVGTNPNLLINGDFQVWQRGTSLSAYTNQYFADRWFVSSGIYYDFAKVSNGCSFNRSSGSSDYIAINQRIEKVLPNGEYTLQISVDGVIHTIHFDGLSSSEEDYSFSDKDAGIKASLYIRNSDHTNLLVYLTKTGGVINWIKLEKGSVATSFVPRFYSEEMALCKRYFVNYISRNHTGMVGSTGTRAYVEVENTINNMRIIPTVIDDISLLTIYCNGKPYYDYSPTISVNAWGELQFDLSITIDGTTAFGIWWKVEEKLWLDAEIY